MVCSILIAGFFANFARFFGQGCRFSSCRCCSARFGSFVILFARIRFLCVIISIL